MTINDLCELLPKDVKIVIVGVFEDVTFPRDETFLTDSLGEYIVDFIRPTAENEISVFLKTQYVKRSN